MSEAIPAQQKMRYKSFNYLTDLQWVGGKAGLLASPGKPEFRVASPPEFRGEEGVWSPEDLFVAAINICTMTTFLAIAGKKGLELVSYTSTADGLLEFVGEGYQFTKVILKPRIVVAGDKDIETARSLLDDAHHKCLIANSICGRVFVEPVITAEALASPRMN